MVGATGFEPKIKLERPLPQREQDKPKTGQNQAMGREQGAGAEQVGADPESSKTITAYITGTQPDPALQALVDTWPDLSPDAKRRIGEIMEADQKARQ